MVTSISDILTTIQQGVTAANNLAQLLSGSVFNSSSLRVSIASTLFLPSSTPVGTGTVTSVNTAYGLTGGPITVSGSLAVSLSFLTNSLTSNVSTSSGSAAYVDGPVVAQGTSGVWIAMGNVTATASTNSNFFVKLWDGTSVLDSAGPIIVANIPTTIALSGPISSPSSNIRISVSNADGVGTVLSFNRSGNAKDCTVTAVRIG